MADLPSLKPVRTRLNWKRTARNGRNGRNTSARKIVATTVQVSPAFKARTALATISDETRVATTSDGTNVAPVPTGNFTEVIAFHPNIAIEIMWSMIGAVTACALRHVATIGFKQATTMFWLRLPPASSCS